LVLGKIGATAARELARYKLNLVGIQEVGGTKGTQYEQKIIILSMEKEMKIVRIFVHHRIVSAVKGVESFRDRMSCIVLRGRWCNIIVLNM